MRTTVIIKGKNGEPLLGAIEYYRLQNDLNNEKQRAHALLTIFSKDDLQGYISRSIKNGGIIYLNKKEQDFLQVALGDQSADNVTEPVLENNLAQFLEKVKQSIQNR